jgi:hypothetical protein
VSINRGVSYRNPRILPTTSSAPDCVNAPQQHASADQVGAVAVTGNAELQHVAQDAVIYYVDIALRFFHNPILP